MIIDFHTHIFPHAIAERTMSKLAACCKIEPETNGTYEGLLESTQEAEIDCSIVLPIATKPSQFRSINEFAAQYLEGEIISFGSIHPYSDNYKEELRTIKSMGMKGIKLHPDYQDTYFNDIHYKRIVSYASELDLIVSVHAGVDPLCPDDVHCTPEMSAELIRDVQPTKLVLAHLGGNQQWDKVEELLVGKDVYLDTAVIFNYIDPEQFIRIMRNHGSDKILFATDSPWASQKKFVEYVKGLEITEDEKEMLLGGNALKLLKNNEK
ncbi:MAG: amidohydrolase family protein [Lachnospiraceae bacterium]